MKYRSHWLLRPILLSLLLCLSYPAFAQEHKAHVHGTSTLLVAVESDELVVELTAPADDIVGFEHAPENEAQERQVDAALAVLKSPAQMFGLPDAASCAVEGVRVLASMHDDDHEDEDHKAKDEHHKDDHHKDDDHAHGEKASGKDHDDDGETHSEFRLRYHFHCGNMGKLASLELLMFERFPRMHRVQVQVISGGGQKSVMLDHDRPRLSF